MNLYKDLKVPEPLPRRIKPGEVVEFIYDLPRQPKRQELMKHLQWNLQKMEKIREEEKAISEEIQYLVNGLFSADNSEADKKWGLKEFGPSYCEGDSDEDTDDARKCSPITPHKKPRRENTPADSPGQTNTPSIVLPRSIIQVTPVVSLDTLALHAKPCDYSLLKQGVFTDLEAYIASGDKAHSNVDSTRDAQRFQKVSSYTIKNSRSKLRFVLAAQLIIDYVDYHNKKHGGWTHIDRQHLINATSQHQRYCEKNLSALQTTLSITVREN